MFSFVGTTEGGKRNAVWEMWMGRKGNKHLKGGQRDQKNYKTTIKRKY